MQKGMQGSLSLAEHCKFWVLVSMLGIQYNIQGNTQNKLIILLRGCCSFDCSNKGELNEQNMDKQRCIICRKALSNGIMIYGRSICKSCEDRLIKSDVDTDLYKYYRDCIKKTVAVSVLKDEITDIYRHQH